MKKFSNKNTKNDVAYTAEYIGICSEQTLINNSDPLGSYTGVPQNKFEKPQQDADDL